MIFYGLSDVGRRRQNNQDSFGYIRIAENAEIYVVCDGMGGANGGNVASEMAVNVFTDYMKNALGTFVDGRSGRLVLPSDSELLGLYAETAEFSCTGLSEEDPSDADDVETGEPNPDESAESEPSEADPETDDSGVSDTEETAEDEAETASDDGSDDTENDGSDDDSDLDGDSPMERLLREAVAAANLEVYGKARADRSLKGMGTTLVAVLVIDGRAYIASVGDSRIYYFEDGGMAQLTHDHSYVQYLIDIGQITPEEALTNPYRNVITRSVGNERTVDADTSSFKLEAVPSYLLLCSDGLTNYVDEIGIAATVWGGNCEQTEESEAEEELRVKCEALIDAANEGGGGDNITALLIKYVG